MRRIMGVLMLAGITTSVLAGCGGGGTTSPAAVPPSIDMTGNWVGNCTSSVFGQGGASFDVQQNGSSITGTYHSQTGGSNDVSGSVSGYTVDFTITVTTPGCSGSFNGTGIVDVPPVGSPTMSFHFSGATNAACGGPESVTGILTLQ